MQFGSFEMGFDSQTKLFYSQTMALINKTPSVHKKRERLVFNRIITVNFTTCTPEPF